VRTLAQGNPCPNLRLMLELFVAFR
jgi:hypothetical protein